MDYRNERRRTMGKFDPYNIPDEGPYDEIERQEVNRMAYTREVEGNRSYGKHKVAYRDDENIPINRRITPVDNEERGLKITYPMMKEETAETVHDKYTDEDRKGYCYGPKFRTTKKDGTVVYLETRRQKKRCIEAIRRAYRKEHAIVYTSECGNISNPFKRKKCIAKYNRGL